ncbi:MAG: transporter substrate-binding domain-containing protein [Oscillospiraceae bacterium]|nr:transporter substrate-binding domain-containing protein [Oscillospiraceae bacterium]
MKRRTIWKKFLSGALALAMCGALAACGGGGNASTQPPATEPASPASPAVMQPADSDLAYVQNKGVLVVGITEFEPMDYQDAEGNWIGFDADMAAAFAGSIGVEVEFQIIEWDNKVFELEGRTIDVVWNGMTLNNEVKAAMECSNPYFDNAQVVIVRADKAADYPTAESVADLAFAVEGGSAAKEQAEAHGFSFTEVTDQATALLEVSSGTADAAIIDFLMAKAMTGEGTSYADLTYTASLNTEQYGVGFRKGSDMAAALNDFFKSSYETNLMQQIAEKYNIAEALVAQ